MLVAIIVILCIMFICDRVDSHLLTKDGNKIARYYEKRILEIQEKLDDIKGIVEDIEK